VILQLNILFRGNGEEDHELGTVIAPTEKHNNTAADRAEFIVIAFVL
jgi:hypothetical protein